MWKRSIGFVIGLFYAAAYGFWTMLITGGGHGNFIWMLLFFTSYLMGLFFPVAGFLVVDLKPVWASASLWGLIILHYILMSFHLLFGLGQDGIEDIQKSWERSPALFVMMTALHLLPPIALIMGSISAQLRYRGSQKYL